MTTDRLPRLESQISQLLSWGMRTSAAILMAGLLLTLARVPLAAVVLDAGIVLVMAIPVARIAASFVDAMRRRDSLLAGSTGIVLFIMAVSLAYAIVGRR